MSIGAEWIINKAKNRIYAISHAKAVYRGSSTVDADLTSLETKMASVQSSILSHEGSITSMKNSISTNSDDIDTLENNVTKLQTAVDNMNNIDSSQFVKSSQITQDIVDSATLVPSAAAVKKVSDIYMTSSAYLHNGIFRGKNITAAYNDGSLLTEVAAGDFSNVYVGDYFTFTYAGSTKTARVAGLNTFMNCGDTALTKPHLVIVCDEAFTTAQMNSSNTTANGYKGSAMNTSVIPGIVTNLKSVFGSHLLTSRELVSNAINSSGYNRFGNNGGCSSGWEWTSQQAMLMSEVEVYGSVVWSSSGYDTGNANKQLPLFRLAPEFINKGRYWYWLKDVAGSTSFCRVNGGGNSLSLIHI